MKDILLWQLLREETPDWARLTPLLEDLAGLPVERRIPYLGLLPGLYAQATPPGRIALVRCLAGARGIFAFRCLVQALADPDPDVRLTAVDSLSQSCSRPSSRSIHALFHPDPEVRLAAVQHRGYLLPDEHLFFLLADPVCAPCVKPLLREMNLPPHCVPAILDFVDDSLLSPAQGQQLVARMPWEKLREELARLEARPPEAVDQLLRAAEKSGPEALRTVPSRDCLDPLLALLWTEREDSDPEQLDSFFAALADWFLRHGSPRERRRLLCALLKTAADTGTWPGRGARLCVALHPRFLLLGWVPPAVRRASVAALYDPDLSIPDSLSESGIRQILDAEICRRPDGHLDLWVIGGVLQCLERFGRRAYPLLLNWCGISAIVDAFASAPEESLPFLGLKRFSEKERGELVEMIGRVAGRSSGPLLAALIHRTRNLDILDDLGGPEAVELFAALAALDRKPGMQLSEKWLPQLSEALAARIGAGHLHPFLETWLALPRPETCALGLSLLARLARQIETESLARTALDLDLATLRLLLTVIPHCAGFPYGQERSLIQAVEEHPDPAVRALLEGRASAAEGDESAERETRVPQAEPAGAVRPLTPVEQDRIASCPEPDLPTALEPCLRQPSTGLCPALDRRPPPQEPSVPICLALLGCHDPLEEVDRAFGRFGASTQEFLGALDGAVHRHWNGTGGLPLLGHAWLWRWDAHILAFAEQALRELGSRLVEMLDAASRLSCAVLAEMLWLAVARMVAVCRWEGRGPSLALALTRPFVATLVDALPGEHGPIAARILVSIHTAKLDPALLDPFRAAVVSALPDLGDETRAILSGWVDIGGLKSGPSPPSRTTAEDPSATLLARVEACADLDELTRFCLNGEEAFEGVQAATEKLVNAGDDGLARLFDLLCADPPPPCGPFLAERLSRASIGQELVEDISAFVREPAFAPRLRYLLGVGLCLQGYRQLLDPVLDAVCAEDEESWFTSQDWVQLQHVGLVSADLAVRLVLSPHPHAYIKAVEILMKLPYAVSRRGPAKALDVEKCAEILQAFLETDSERLHDLRLRVARWLHERGHMCGFPLVFRWAMGEGLAEVLEEHIDLFAASPDLANICVSAALTAGDRLVSEGDLLGLMDGSEVPAAAFEESYRLLLAESPSLETRGAVVHRLSKSPHRAARLRRLAAAFVWGIHRGRELTGRLFTIEMHGGEELGFTSVDEDRLYITPLPVLRGERDGDEVVRGLILHELGHHRYHRGPEREPVSEQAAAEDLTRLLNLVMDEHLERNLRSQSRPFGNRLKRLAAYAFQHAARELPVESLFRALQARAFEVLSAVELGAARQDDGVRVENGKLLQEMERAGMSFPRFVRALRMGLGDRHNDPLVAAALKLFRRKRFRHSSLPELLELARQLRQLFGWQTSLLQSLDQDASLRPDPADLAHHGEGISPDELRAEIQRQLDQQSRKRGPAKDRDESGEPGITFNQGPEEQFAPITTVVHVPFDPRKSAGYAARVARPARQMRRFLDELGLRMEPRHHRLRGHALDRGRLPALILRSDPRVLVAREPMVRTDLFLGLLVDCSSSMSFDDNIERAKLFGALLAEAARDMRGVDARLFGFTHSVIYDAGDARRCAVHALQAGGGNNDAAALWHAAQVARSSRRQARLLVMISDGMPTECSTAALRNLVDHLTRRLRICCAQVAVRPLEEICFPHYVELREEDPLSSVRAFGAIVARLVRRLLHGG